MSQKEQVLQWSDDAEEDFAGLSTVGALLPVVADAGVFADDDGTTYVFDTYNKMTAEIDSVEFFDALRYQVNHASRNQVSYYVDWIDCYTQSFARGSATKSSSRR